MCFPLHGTFELAQHQLLVKNTRAAQWSEQTNLTHSRGGSCVLSEFTGFTLKTTLKAQNNHRVQGNIRVWELSAAYKEEWRLFLKSQRLPNCSWMEINEQAWLADCVPWLQADGVKPWSTSIHSSIHLSLLIWPSTLILSVWRDHFATLLVWPAEYHRTHGQNNRHTLGKCKECSVCEHHCVDELMLKPWC